MPALQEIIHQLEEGAWVRYVKTTAIVLAWIALTALYNLREFRSFTSPEAMEAAQLARRIASGQGFTTDVIRPISIHLIETHHASRWALPSSGHPDLMNPPLYPLLLAGWMRVMPFDFQIPEGQDLGRYQPEVLIALLNQVLLVVAALLLFGIARRLFDSGVAWFASAMFVGSDLIWRFSISGHATLLLIILFLLLVRSMMRIEKALREEEHHFAFYGCQAGIIGLLLGLGCLTRYSFGFFAIPVVVFFALYSGRRRSLLSLTTIITFMVVISPWLLRNYNLCGSPFGIPGFAWLYDTPNFPGKVFERTLKLKPGFISFEDLSPYIKKLMVNSAEILQKDLPQLGRSWLTAFFLAGFLIAFKNQALTRIRIFLILSMIVIIPVQALGKTYLSSLSHEVNSENLLVIVAPLVFVYGTGFFYVLLENLILPSLQWRRWVICAVGLVMCFPLILTFLPPRPMTIAYPPYWPALIQRIGHFYEPNEALMSDAPWAVAWYGQRSSVLLTLDFHKDFAEVSDFHRAIKGLYLTQLTLNESFLDSWIKGENRVWGRWLGRFIIDSLVGGDSVTNFPLRSAWGDIFPDQVLLSDWERWKGPKK